MVNGAYLATIVFFVCTFPSKVVAHHEHDQTDATVLQDSRHEVSITTIGAAKYDRVDAEGSRRIMGIGNNLDLLYTIPIQLAGDVFAVNLDTGSSDLWVVSDRCHTNACKNATVARYPISSFTNASIHVHMLYGDSKSGTFASGMIGYDMTNIAGIAMPCHPFGLIEDTSNLLVQFGATGIFGLGFPAASSIQAALTKTETGSDINVDDYIKSTVVNGPLLSRIAMTKVVENPMFAISLQRHTNGLDGQGILSVGSLPDGIDNSSLTWAPVRLYSEEDGGMGAPSYAPDEVYPYRWEIDIDGVFLDGKRLPDSTIAADGVDSKRISALIDTGNSLLRGPEDVVVKILQSVSPRFDPNVAGSVPSLPCNTPRTLAFQIGGQMFPIDPRDFISQLDPDNAVVCQADNLVPADAPKYGNLFRWSLGTPFFRSNLVAFHYGNLTHPSVDPPRIGIRSNVPSNVNLLMKEAVLTASRKGQNSLGVVKQVAVEVMQADEYMAQSIVVNPIPASLRHEYYARISSNQSSVPHAIAL